MQDQTARAQSGRTTDATPPLGRYYEVGGRRLLLHRLGSGSPAVVFLPGAGTVGLDYLNVQERAAALTTSVLYDRAGTGWSDRVKLPRTSAQVTDELRDLLRTAGVPPPYVLVGHSLGGLYARHYAQRFPDEMAGLLLLDPAHEDYPSMPKPTLLGGLRQGLALIRVLLHYKRLYRGLFAQEMADWPEEIRQPLIERHVSMRWLPVGLREAKNIDQLYDEVRHAGPLPDVPLIVLTSMGIDGFKEAVLVGRIRVAAPRGDRRQAAALHGAGRISPTRREPPHR